MPEVQLRPPPALVLVDPVERGLDGPGLAVVDGPQRHGVGGAVRDAEPNDHRVTRLRALGFALDVERGAIVVGSREHGPRFSPSRHPR